MPNNILDKVIESEEEQKKSELNPQELVNLVLSSLNSREREVINARYGLDREVKETLEGIGKKYGITRERVRQIENNALKKAVQTEGNKDKLNSLLLMVVRNINKGGYLRLEESLLEELLINSSEIEVDKNRLRFIFSRFLGEHIEPVEIVHTERAWRVKDKENNHFSSVVDGVKNILTKHNKPLHLNDILSELKSEIVEDDLKLIMDEIEDWQEAVSSYLEVSRHFKKNLFDKWGLIDWRSVNPKRMRDKVYLVMQKHNKPLHYKELADRINDEKFDNKKAHPATIHNELILDDRFVLIGRGIYALNDWGYKPGLIVDVVRAVLAQAGSPLTKDEILKEVLKQRMVKEGSVNLALSNKDVFEKLADGSYGLKA